MTPTRNDSRNDPTPSCPICGNPFARTGRRRYCSDACRQAAWRHRRPHPPTLAPQPRRSPRANTVYICPDCDTRYLGEQWCPDCVRPCRRLAPGGPCPHCDEPVTIDDVLPNRTEIKIKQAEG